LKLKFGTSLTSQGIATISETILISLRLFDVVDIYVRAVSSRVRLRTFL